jgi:hypothetical protein
MRGGDSIFEKSGKARKDTNVSLVFDSLSCFVGHVGDCLLGLAS